MRLLRRRPLLGMAILSVTATAVGIAIVLSIDWFPAQGSSAAPKIDNLYDVLLIASVPVFVLVMSVALYSVFAFRAKPGDMSDGEPIHGNTKLEIVWTAFPAILLVGLCTYAYTVLTDIEKKPKHEMVVNVTGQQFAWSFEYPRPGGGKPVKSDQLYLPDGAHVLFKIKSLDVIHDFWVPQFRLKIDAVPGLTTSYRVKTTRVGTYQVVCAELCGLGHSTMRQTAHVMPAARFNSWIAKKRQAATTQS